MINICYGYLTAVRIRNDNKKIKIKQNVEDYNILYISMRVYSGKLNVYIKREMGYLGVYVYTYGRFVWCPFGIIYSVPTSLEYS